MPEVDLEQRAETLGQPQGRRSGSWRLMTAVGLASCVMTLAVVRDGFVAQVLPSTAAIGSANDQRVDGYAVPGRARGGVWSATDDADGATMSTSVPDLLARTDPAFAGPATGAASTLTVVAPPPTTTLIPSTLTPSTLTPAILTPSTLTVPTPPIPPLTVPTVSTATPGGAQGGAANPIVASPTVPPASIPVAGDRVGGDGPVCTVERLPAAAGLDPFYTQVCWASGIPVVSSDGVDGRALQAAADIVVNMLASRPDLRDRLVSGRLRVGIIGVQQRAVDLPEYRDLPTNFPETNWDSARAYGATPRRPLLAVPEENLVCSPADTYPGQSVLAHELGHTVLDMGVALQDGTFKGRVATAYKAARSNPVYAQTYALVNVDEYWAEGVQDFFDASRAAYGPNGGGDGYDGPIASRDALRANDPVLYGLISSVFTETSWRPSCPA